MRIKINDKIYRLKEVESGVDSLMELVEEQKYKNGDFVYEDGRIMIVKSYPNMCHALAYPEHSNTVYYNSSYVVYLSSPTFRHATEEERQILFDAMRKDGKRWNDDKRCIEDIPKRKFKAGDKVKIKDGISSKTHIDISPSFVSGMDEFIGMNLTVAGYTERGCVFFNEDEMEYDFAEDWLEPYEELKKGDLAIFWDSNKGSAFIGEYDCFLKDVNYPHRDHRENVWANAIKFESKEQFKRFIKGEL